MQGLSEHRSFFDFFPPPKFLSMPSVGVDLSDGSVKFVELLAVPGGVAVGRFGEENIPRGAISDGVIQNAAVVERALATLQKTHGLSFARVACPEKETYLLELSLPVAPLASLRETIASQFEELVPMKRDESVFDIEVVGVSEEKKEVRVQVSAVSRALANLYEKVFKKAGVIPLALEAESRALARAVVPKGENDAFLIVDIGKLETTIAVTKKGSVPFSVSFDGGGETITKALSDILSLPFEKAERAKRLYGLLPNPGHGEVAEAVVKSFQPIEEKIRQYILHYGNKTSSNGAEMPVRRIYMCGGGSNIPGLAEHLSEVLLIPAILANPWVNTISFDEYIPSVSFDEALRYATAIGLAMPVAKMDFDK
ncbi:MAG: pilus assembly protein PilM [Parcubacteria group bacterium]|nr:pilus assembly protein PilM [Parcubacteria group bacterium]